MRRVNPAPIASFQDRVVGDAGPILKDADLVDKVLHLDNAFARRFPHRVVIAIEPDHTFMADPPFHRQHRAVGDGWQRFECRFFSSPTIRSVLA